MEILIILGSLLIIFFTIRNCERIRKKWKKLCGKTDDSRIVNSGDQTRDGMSLNCSQELRRLNYNERCRDFYSIIIITDFIDSNQSSIRVITENATSRLANVPANCHDANIPVLQMSEDRPPSYYECIQSLSNS